VSGSALSVYSPLNACNSAGVTASCEEARLAAAWEDPGTANTVNADESKAAQKRPVATYWEDIDPLQTRNYKNPKSTERPKLFHEMGIPFGYFPNRHISRFVLSQASSVYPVRAVSSSQEFS
jgi:hypothetical protein